MRTGFSSALTNGCSTQATQRGSSSWPLMSRQAARFEIVATLLPSAAERTAWPSDGSGRLYVATPNGIQVLSPQGSRLGLIPMPRQATSLAFAGPDKRTLYAVGRGNDGPSGDEQWARSIYRFPMVTQGFTGRAK